MAKKGGAPTKSEVLTQISKDTTLSRKQVASVFDSLSGVIKKHELTRPDKEDDRVLHIETLNSQTGPVFLTWTESRRFSVVERLGFSTWRLE